MPGLNSVMDASLSALFAAQAGMATTGHNIANANTPGYSRQLVTFSARRPDILPYGAIGRGVEIQGIRRMQDDFLMNNLRVQNSRLSSYSAVDSALYEVESILGSVDNDHLGNSINNFFNSWEALSQPPINETLKQNVAASAASMINSFQAIKDSLDDLEANIETSIQGEISSLNRLLTETANMNEQIMSAEANGQAANDLRDQRDHVITEISKIAEISVIEREDGTKDVILAGRTMVTRDTVTEFQSTYVETSNGYQMAIVTQGNMQNVELSTGRLEGLLNARDEHITQVRNKLDAVAKQIIDEVNELHTQGRTTASSGLEFFTGDNMHTIGLNPALAADANLIAAGRTDAAGDNEIALAIAHLSNEGLGGNGKMSVGDTYRSMLLDIASKRSNYDFMVNNQQNVVAALETKVASISGVSLDEEGANMVRYQNSYNAAAKVISTVQQMYDTLMNMV